MAEWVDEEPAARVSRSRLVIFALGVVGLVVLHLWLLPERLQIPTAMGAALLVANEFAWASLLLRWADRGRRSIAWFVLGYAVMAWLLWPMVAVSRTAMLLLVVCIFAYSALHVRPWLTGYLFLFLLTLRFAPEYLYPLFFVLAFLYTTLPPFWRMMREGRDRFMPACFVFGLVLVVGLVVPVLTFALQSSPQTLRQAATDPEVRAAIARSLRTSAAATGVVLVTGVPLAYAMVRQRFVGWTLLNSLIDLPIVIPPPVIGITLLVFLGPKTRLGMYLHPPPPEYNPFIKWLESGAGIDFEQLVVQVFVGAPFLIRSAMVAFSGVDPRYERVARTLGASAWQAFFRVTLPLAAPGILVGAILCWLRAMGEFGATRVVADFPRVAPVLTYYRFEQYGLTEARPVAILIVALCLVMFIGLWLIRTAPWGLAALARGWAGTANATR